MKNKTKDNSEQPKKKGRPRTNPIATETPTETTAGTDETSKKRGRPKKKYVSRYNNDQPVVPTKVSSVDGYCPNCHTALCSFDFKMNASGTEIVFVCYKCSKEMAKEDLLVAKPTKSEEKYTYKTKREYLEDCLQVPDDHHVPMASPVVISGDLSGLSVVDGE